MVAGVSIDMTKWDVVEDGNYWVGSFLVGPCIDCEFCDDRRFVSIMPSRFARELAIDALLDFMDRLRTGRVPQGMTDPDDLMEVCVSAARRQR